MITPQMKLARDWLRRKNEPTMVHALRCLESGLKEWVDDMLLEQKAPYYIARELWNRLHGEIEDWQIPSRKSIKLYRDKYFVHTPLFTRWVVKNSNDKELKYKYYRLTGERLFNQSE